MSITCPNTYVSIIQPPSIIILIKFKHFISSSIRSPSRPEVTNYKVLEYASTWDLFVCFLCLRFKSTFCFNDIEGYSWFSALHSELWSSVQSSSILSLRINDRSRSTLSNILSKCYLPYKDLALIFSVTCIKLTSGLVFLVKHFLSNFLCCNVFCGNPVSSIGFLYFEKLKKF